MASAAPYDWYLAAWMKALGVKQADLIRELGWSKAKASDIVTGKQRYTRDLVNEISIVLKIRPFELLLPPADAYAIRGYRDNAVRIAASRDLQEPTGTAG